MKEFIKYGIGGIATTLVDLIVFAMCIRFATPIIIATTVSWIFAVLFSYIVNTVIFNQDFTIALIIKFTLARLCVLLLNIIAVYIYTPDNFIVAYKAFLSLVFFIANFIATKLTFSKKGYHC